MNFNFVVSAFVATVYLYAILFEPEVGDTVAEDIVGASGLLTVFSMGAMLLTDTLKVFDAEATPSAL
jgi:hypothetical protein